VYAVYGEVFDVKRGERCEDGTLSVILVEMEAKVFGFLCEGPLYWSHPEALAVISPSTKEKKIILKK